MSRFAVNPRRNSANGDLVEGLLYAFRVVTTNALITADDGTLFVNAGQKAITLALPPAASMPGRAFYVQKIDPSANPVTVRARGGELIDNLPTVALANPFDRVKVQSRGTQWHAIVRTGGSPGPAGPVGIQGPKGDKGDPGTGGGTVSTPNVQQALTGSFPGTGPFALPSTPVAASEAVYYRGERLKRVASAPGIGEYTISAANVTTGFTVGAATDLWADYYTASSTALNPNIQTAVTGSVPGTGPFALSATPSVGTEAVYHRELRLKRVGAAPGIGEYTISGANITAGFTVFALADLIADFFA